MDTGGNERGYRWWLKNSSESLTELSARGESAARDVAEVLWADLSARDSLKPLERWDLANGLAGTTLFFEELASLDPTYMDLAEQVRRRMLRLFHERPEYGYGGLFGGAPGVAWLLRTSDKPLSLETSRFLTSLDLALAKRMYELPASASLDVISGVAGVGIYAVEGCRRGYSTTTLVNAAVELLVERSLRTPNGTYWRMLSPQRDRSPRVGLPVDLGMAHGVPGVIAFLGTAISSDVLPPRMEKAAVSITREAINWLRVQELGERDSAFFPSAVFERAERQVDCTHQEILSFRPSWCYGDLSVAVAAWFAGDVLSDPDVLEWSINLTQRSTERMRPDVMDPFLCHGCAGVAQALRTLGTRARDGITCTNAIRVATRCIEAVEEALQANGAQEAPSDIRHAPGFLQGYAGVGLFLLSLTGPARNSRWEVPFLFPQSDYGPVIR